MKRLVLVIGVAVLAAACHPSLSECETVASITPVPVSFERSTGSFKLKGSAIRATSSEAEKIACSFVDKLAAASGVSVRRAEDANIIFSIDDSLDLPCEGYTLTVTDEKVEAVGKDAAGLFYAVQSLYQLLPPQIEGKRRVRGADWTIPCVSVRDYPRFAWRGVHVDPCRHFLSVEAIKKHIDILAGYKINTVHLHLTDDQGWRIEIKKYPKLTEIGGWRTEFDGSIHGGFYTQEEMRDLVAYAAERFVTLVPEIEMPGHAIAAVRAYPELSCEKKQIGTFYTWGTTNTVFCLPEPRALLELKAAIRRSEARAADRSFGLDGSHVHFLNLPFYESGGIIKLPRTQKDVDIIKNLMKELAPDQIYMAGDLADPHGTHRVCTEAAMEALFQLKEEGVSWAESCTVWLYRGAWMEWDLGTVDMAVPISPAEVIVKRHAIYHHLSQKDIVPFPGEDPREFWQRAEDRTQNTARLYSELGMAKYQAIELFVKYKEK